MTRAPRPKPSLRLVVVWLGALIAGILLASVVSLPSPLLFIAAGLVLSASLILPQRRVLTTFVLLALPFLLFGLARGHDASARAANDISTFAGGPSVRVQGVVKDEPQLLAGRAGKAAVSLTLRVTALDNYGRTQPVSGLLRATLTQVEPPMPKPGDALWVRGAVTVPPGVRNPGGFDYRAFLARRGIYATLVARRAADVVPVEGVPNGLNVVERLAHMWRTSLLDCFRVHLNADDAALLGAVTLSTRSGLPADLTDALARDGALYILSTSGLHLSALTFLLALCLRRLGVSHRIANLVALGLLWLFVLASGANIAALRAGITLTILLFGPIVRRSAEPLHSLAVAAFVILVLDPLALFDAGFQLSFATIATLLFYLPPLQALLLPWEPGQRAATRRLYLLLDGLLAGFVAQVGCCPLTVAYFNQLSWIAPLATVLLGPLSVLLLVCGLLAAVVSAVLPAAWAVPLWFGIHLLIELLRGLTFAFASVPGAAVVLASPGPVWIVLYYLILGGCAPFVRRYLLQKRFFAPQANAMGSLGSAASNRRPDGDLGVTSPG